MIWLIAVSLIFVILGSCQSQHEGSKNNILDPYISKPPALGEETGGENRGIVSDMITGGLKEILRPKGPAHVCGTKMMFFELPKGQDRYFYTRDNVPDQGICDSKSNPFTFWYFCQKMC